VEPIVASMSTSFNIVEGENFRLPCLVYGYPTPSIEWRRGLKFKKPIFFILFNINVMTDVEGNEGEWETLIADGHFMFEPNNEDIVNGTLLIKEVKIEDRDNYMCYAFNELGSHNGTTLIRVIGKHISHLYN
jgi:hypothetical protein